MNCLNCGKEIKNKVDKLGFRICEHCKEQYLEGMDNMLREADNFDNREKCIKNLLKRITFYVKQKWGKHKKKVSFLARR